MKKTILFVFAMILAMNSKADQIWWGYFSDNDANSIVYDGYLGWGSATTVDAGVKILKSNPLTNGGTIKSVRFWLGDDISAISSDVTVWISKNLPSKVSGADYTQTVSKSALTGRLNEVELTTPYSIGDEDFYIGYSFRINTGAWPVMGGGKDTDNGWYYRVEEGQWDNLFGQGYGNLAFQILLDGVTLSNYSVTPSDFGTRYVEKGGVTYVPVTITNYGSEAITSINYTINNSDEQNISIDALGFNSSTDILIPFNADNDTRKNAKTFTITKVNGNDNEATVPSSTGALITISEKLTPIPVVEEFTGTWCGWCTVGYDGMEKTKETYGDKVVLIAAHNSDPMEIADYNPVSSRATGYPSSTVNRSMDIYPSISGLASAVDQSLNNVTVGEIAATASWADEAMTTVKINTETKFVYSEDEGNYGIAFVLIEDGMSGSGSEWAQSNYLSGNADYAESNPFWYNSPAKVTDVIFNHVAVAAWDILNGVNGSVSPTIVADEIQQFSFDADIKSKSVIQDKSKLKIAALLIDRTTGIIVNAAEAVIQDYNATGINTVQKSSMKDAGRYLLDGRKVSTPHSGLNIIKMSDGTIRKEFVK